MTVVGPVHVVESRLQVDAPFPDASPQPVLNLRDLLQPAWRHGDAIPPPCCRGGGIWHGGLGQRVLLKVRNSEAPVNISTEVLVTEHAIIPHVCSRHCVELDSVDLLCDTHHCEDCLHLPNGADALAQCIKVLEMLVQAHPALDNLGHDLLHGVQPLVAPLCVVGLQVQIAPGVRWHLVLHRLGDVIVQGHEVHISLRCALRSTNTVPLSQQVQISLADVLLEREISDELILRHLATNSWVHARG
mmetsp:Transcript_66295/g.153967  ORF Transcript_66295/g.153967 Transcript_66295/m.153967 type:complete len:245 (+) Transcript_66295:349-1083(+)